MSATVTAARRYALTDNEMDILRRVARGQRRATIGLQTHRSLSTVKTHLANACAKLGAVNAPHAVALAYEAGVLVPGDVAGEVGP